MKKLISLISGLVLTFGIGAVSVSAESEFLDYKPQIVYNADVTSIEDVRMTDGRVFIPLRAVFEMMGATVDYSNETTQITVVRDNTKVEFLREGTSMTITDLTGVSPVQVIDAEIRCDYEIERTFVPVRFISNALGARVGWDGETGSVYILDTYTLAQDLKANTPKLAELLKKTATLDENVKSNYDLTAKLSLSDGESPATTANLKANLTESEFDSKSTYGVKLDLTHENLDALTEGYKIGQLEGITFDLIKNEEAMYFKTNAGSKISTILPEETYLHIAESVVTADTWFRIDYSYVEKEFGKLIADAIFKDEKIDPATFNADEAVNDLVAVLAMTMGQSEDDVTYSEMVAVKGAFDAYKEIFSNITIEDTADGSSIIKMSFTLEDLLTIIPKSAFSTEEEYNTMAEMIRQMLSLDVNVSSEISNNIETSTNAEMKFGFNFIFQNVSFEMTFAGTSEKIEKAPEFTIPENSISVETIMTLLDM